MSNWISWLLSYERHNVPALNRQCSKITKKNYKSNTVSKRGHRKKVKAQNLSADVIKVFIKGLLLFTGRLMRMLCVIATYIHLTVPIHVSTSCKFSSLSYFR